MVLALLMVSALSGSAAEADQKLVVRNLTVFVVDKHGAKLSAKDLFKSTVPEFVRTTRSRAPVKERGRAMPMGLITIEGGGEEEQVDVLLELKSAAMFTQWPTARVARNRLLWSDIVLGADEPASVTPAKGS